MSQDPLKNVPSVHKKQHKSPTRKILNTNDNLRRLFGHRHPPTQARPAGESKSDQILHELNEMEAAEQAFVNSLKDERLGVG